MRALLLSLLLALPVTIHAQVAMATPATIPAGTTTVTATIAGSNAVTVVFSKPLSTLGTATMTYTANGQTQTWTQTWNVDQHGPQGAGYISGRYLQPAVYKLLQGAYAALGVSSSPEKIWNDAQAIISQL